jgi:hypothetical protein
VNEIEQKKIIIQRIISHLNPVPANCVQELLGQNLKDLQVILDKLATTRDQEQVEEATLAHSQEMIRQSKADHAWAYCLAKVSLNGKRLVECAANREILEGMVQPHEKASPALYETILKQYSPQFSWAVPQPTKSAADREAEFAKICRDNLLSLCDANRQMHRDRVALENWAGASGIERAAFQAEAAQARQIFLIKHATPQQLKQEAAYESQVNREQAQREEADRQHKFVSQAQAGLYAVLPAVNANGETMDAKYFRRISTVDYPLFKQLVRKFGSAAVTSRLRGENWIVVSALPKL